MKATFSTYATRVLLSVAIFMALFLLPEFALAQTAPATIESVLSDLLEDIRLWVDIIFGIGVLIGTIRVVISFFQGNPNAGRHLLHLAIAIMVYFGVDLFLDIVAGW